MAVKAEVRDALPFLGTTLFLYLLLLVGGAFFIPSPYSELGLATVVVGYGAYLLAGAKAVDSQLKRLRLAFGTASVLSSGMWIQEALDLSVPEGLFLVYFGCLLLPAGWSLVELLLMTVREGSNTGTSLGPNDGSADQ